MHQPPMNPLPPVTETVSAIRTLSFLAGFPLAAYHAPAYCMAEIGTVGFDLKLWRSRNGTMREDVDLVGAALFVRIVEDGSLSAAGRTLGLPKATVSRRWHCWRHRSVRRCLPARPGLSV